MPEIAKLIYTAQSKRDFYCRDAVCQYVIEQRNIPLNPFRVFGYFLGDRVPRDIIRRTNYEMLTRCDELWVFGELLADGVIVEITQALNSGMPIRFHSISSDATSIRRITTSLLSFEVEVEERSRLVDLELWEHLVSGRVQEIVKALGRTSELTWA